MLRGTTARRRTGDGRRRRSLPSTRRAPGCHATARCSGPCPRTGCGEHGVGIVVVTTGREAYRRADGIAVVPAALFGA